MITLEQDTIELLDKVNKIKADLSDTLMQLSDNILRDTDGVLSCCAHTTLPETQLYVECKQDVKALELVKGATQFTRRWADKENTCYAFECSGHALIMLVDNAVINSRKGE